MKNKVGPPCRGGSSPQGEPMGGRPLNVAMLLFIPPASGRNCSKLQSHLRQKKPTAIQGRRPDTSTAGGASHRKQTHKNQKARRGRHTNSLMKPASHKLTRILPNPKGTQPCTQSRILISAAFLNCVSALRACPGYQSYFRGLTTPAMDVPALRA
jgi:hypothetical protein